MQETAISDKIKILTVEQETPSSWLDEHIHQLEKSLQTHGAVLLRDFDLVSASSFHAFCQRLLPQLLDYQYQSTPRTMLGKSIYTATEYPADRVIPLHNENSYTNAWPEVIIFCCLLPARFGGQTPIANSANVLNRLPRDLVEEFQRKKCRYTRYYYPGIDLSWQTVFQTENRQAVEVFCKKNGINFRWLNEPNGPELMTSQVRPATIEHPAKGVTCWFNQVNLFHPSTLAEADKQALLPTIKDNQWPRNVTFGDGSEIPEEAIQTINTAYDEEALYFDWQMGDILLLDNMLYAHGRTTFEGPRKIIVAMC